MHIYSLSRKEIHGATAQYQSRLPRPSEGMGKGSSAENGSVDKSGEESARRSNQKRKKQHSPKVQAFLVRSLASESLSLSLPWN